jgi:hypothetical protein
MIALPNVVLLTNFRKENIMAKNENRRLSRATLAEDETTLNALKTLAGYTPANSTYTVAAIEQAQTSMRAAQASEDQGVAALATLRDTATSAEWEYHNLILGAKDQVRALYGKDSPQVQEIGLKRTSEYKTRKPKARPPVQ